MGHRKMVSFPTSPI